MIVRRVRVSYDHGLTKTLALLANPGLLLASTKRSGASNVMTIGWGTVGIIWGKPLFVVLVRPSRYTYGFIHDSGLFTVNVPTEEMREWVNLCGTRSGRELDKFAACGLKTTPGHMVDAVTIDACPMVYECRVVHHNDVLPPNLAPEIERSSYRGSDYHRVFYGEILGAYAAEGW